MYEPTSGRRQVPTAHLSSENHEGLGWTGVAHAGTTDGRTGVGVTQTRISNIIDNNALLMERL